MAEAVIEENRKITPILPSALEFAGHAYQQLSVRVPAGTTVEDIENKELWSFVVPKLIEGGEIRILPLDMAYRAMALVTHCDKVNVRVKVYSFVELLPRASAEAPKLKAISGEYVAKLRGVNKWCVQKIKGENVGDWLKEHIPTKNEADTWIEKYILALSGDEDATEWLNNLDY